MSRDVIQICQNLNEHLTNAQKYQQQLNIAEISLESLIDDTPSPSKKLQLKRKFESFYQLAVDQYVHSGDLLKALELAEERKNICLSWFYKDWGKSFENLLSSLEIKSNTAIIYWHISPTAITTFILKSNAPIKVVTNEQVLEVTKIFSNSRPKIKYKRLNEFEQWMSSWKRNYQIHGSSKEKGSGRRRRQSNLNTQDEHLWRDEMDVSLLQLSQILNIPGIIETYLTDVNQLVLIPHRDLHLVPLHALFSFPYSCSKQEIFVILCLYIVCKLSSLFKVYNFKKIYLSKSFISSISSQIYSTSYLPSIQATKYLKQSNPNLNVLNRFLSVEHPESGTPLPFAQIECEVIATLFNTYEMKRISGRNATKHKIETALREGTEIFHFTGHGYHDINSPLKSALLLAGKDGRLTLGEILRMPLSNYYIVCLSACETGMTSKTNIVDEFVGLSSGFLAKGAAHVVSTLWTVPDTPSALVMIKFYHLLRRGIPNHKGSFESLALTKAQMWLRSLTYRKLIRLYRTVKSKLPIEENSIRLHLRDELEELAKMSPDDHPYDHPYYWAAFKITGIHL
jgi:CHAT domain-containing protein